VYKRLQAQYIKEQEDKGNTKAQGNVAIATRMSSDQIKDASFPYFTIPSYELYKSYAIPPYAMPLVTSHKHALYTTNKTYLYLDSGAMRHFSGLKSDFTQLKHWAIPEIVHVANG